MDPGRRANVFTYPGKACIKVEPKIVENFYFSIGLGDDNGWCTSGFGLVEVDSEHRDACEALVYRSAGW